MERSSGIMRRWRRHLVVIAAAAMISPAVLILTAFGQVADAGDRGITGSDSTVHMGSLVEEVLASNANLLASRRDVQALWSVPDQVSALPDPMLMTMYAPRTMMTGERSQWRIEQPLPWPGKRSLQARIAELDAEVAEQEVETTERDLVASTQMSLVALARIQRVTDLVLEFRERLEDYARIAATQYEVGRGNQSAILKAQVEKNALEQQLAGLAADRRTEIEQVAWLLNRPLPPGATIDTGELDAAFSRIDLPEVGALEEIARANRPEVDALAAAEQQSEARAALGRLGYRPDLGVSLTYFDMVATDEMAGGTGRDAVAIGLSLRLPVQRGRVRAEIEEARARTAAIRHRRDALFTQFRSRLSALANRIDLEQDQLDRYQNLLIPQAEANVEAALSAYTTGQVDFLDLLDAERMLFQLQMDLASNVERFRLAIIELERELGLSRAEGLSSALRRSNVNTALLEGR